MDSGKHTQSQNIDFKQAQGFDIFFVPLNYCALGHAGVFHWHQCTDGALGDNKAPHMLGQMSGEAEDLLQQIIKMLGHMTPGTGFFKLRLEVTTAIPPG